MISFCEQMFNTDVCSRSFGCCGLQSGSASFIWRFPRVYDSTGIWGFWRQSQETWAVLYWVSCCRSYVTSVDVCVNLCLMDSLFKNDKPLCPNSQQAN